MNEKKAVIDFGTGKISIAVGESTPSGIRIISYQEAPSAGIKSGEILNDSRVEQTLGELLKKTAEETGIEIDSASVTLGGKVLHCVDYLYRKNRNNPSERIDKEEIDIITRERYLSPTDNGEAVFEAAPQKYNVDDSIGQTLDEIIGMEGSMLEAEYLIISGKEELINKRRNVLKNCGVRMEKAILSPIASARAVLTAPESENGVVLVDIGCGTTEIVIIRDNVIRDAAVIPFAGQSITTDIKEETSTSLKWAEKVKLEYGCCCEEYVPENKKLELIGQEGYSEGEIDLTLLSRVIEARMSEILESVRYFIDKSKYASRIPAGVVITGGTCYLENITQLAKAILGRKVRLAAPLSSITDNSVDGAFDAGASSAVGAVLEIFSPVLSHSILDNGKPSVKANQNNPPILQLFQDEPPVNAVKKQKKKTEQKTKEPKQKEPKTQSLWDKMFGPANDKA